MRRVSWLVACLSLMTSTAQEVGQCPGVKIVGLGESDKIALFQGCPGLPGPPGPKGEAGSDGKRGVDEGTDLCKTGSRDCQELFSKGNTLSGWYTVFLSPSKPLAVFCDMDTDGGGWIVFQRRIDGSVDFFQDWATYKRGFGSQLGDFWMGNDNLHLLTAQETFMLQVDLIDFDGNHSFAKYRSFQIAAEDENYRLILGDFVEGDSLTYHNNHPFSTKDRDNDRREGNCARDYRAAWWYGNCYLSNLNGLYLRGHHKSFPYGIN